MEEINFGFGNDTLEKVREIQKSLEVGYNYGTTDQTGFGATRLENLETTMKMLVAKEDTFRFYKAVKKSKTNSLVVEFTSMQDIGGANFYSEGGSPEEYDEVIKRELEKVKFIGALGKIPLTATVGKSQVDNKAMIVKAKTLAITRELDYKIFYGNSDNVSVEFNGILKQFNDRVRNPSQNIIDLRGKHLVPETFTQGAMVIQDNYGNPSNLKFWGSPQSFYDYANGLIKNKQFFVNGGAVNNIAAVPRKFTIAEGEGAIETDLFLRHRGQSYHDRPHPKLNEAKTAFVGTSNKAPTTLNAASCSCTPTADTTTRLAAATYTYCVVPVNRYGIGAAFELANTVIGANENATFTIADNGSVTGQEASAFELYRKASTGGKEDYRYVCTFKASAASKVDNGDYIPGTTTGFLFDWDFDQVFDYKELLAMVKLPLAQIDDSERWLQKHYGSPIVFNPNKIVVVQNIGSTAW